MNGKITMNRQKIILLVINLIGGAAVLGSYVLGLRAHPGQVGALWGGVPAWMHPYYTINMFLAAAGYLAVLYLLLFRVDPSARIGPLPYRTFSLIYLLILIPSSLWMPLTFMVAEAYTPARWLAVVAVLILTGLASIALLASMVMLRPRLPAGLFRLSITGSAFLVLQTAVLDAIVWTLYYLK